MQQATEFYPNDDAVDDEDRARVLGNKRSKLVQAIESCHKKTNDKRASLDADSNQWWEVGETSASQLRGLYRKLAQIDAQLCQLKGRADSRMFVSARETKRQANDRDYSVGMTL